MSLSNQDLMRAKLGAYVENCESKTAAARNLFVSPRALGRYMTGERLIPEAISDVLNGEYSDTENVVLEHLEPILDERDAEEARAREAATPRHSDAERIKNLLDEVIDETATPRHSDDERLKSILDQADAESGCACERGEPCVGCLYDDDDEAVLDDDDDDDDDILDGDKLFGEDVMREVVEAVLGNHAQSAPEVTPVARYLYTAITFKGNYAMYPLLLVARQIDHREGRQFTRILDEKGNVFLVNMDNVESISTRLLPDDSPEIRAYKAYDQNLSPEGGFLVTQDRYTSPSFFNATLDDVIQLRSGSIPFDMIERDVEYDNVSFVAVGRAYNTEI